MKTIYLWVTGEGWKPFDLEKEETKAALTEREISIGNYAEIGDYAKIGNYAEIGDYAKIGNYAEIGDYAKIGDNEIILKTIFITGTKHVISWWGKGVINIGCQKYDIAYWKANFERIGKIEGYTEAEIAEYGMYIEICEKLQTAINK